MTNQQYVIRAAQMMKLALIKPTKGNPGIVGTDWASGFGKCVIDALTWAEARKQVDTYRMSRACL